MNWCGGLVARRGAPLLRAQGAAVGASVVVLVVRHGGLCGPPSALGLADQVHPLTLSLSHSQLDAHLKKKHQGVKVQNLL